MAVRAADQVTKPTSYALLVNRLPALPTDLFPECVFLFLPRTIKVMLKSISYVEIRRANLVALTVHPQLSSLS
jgi:hypothetical protein